MEERCRPGQVRDAIVTYLSLCRTPASVAEIRSAVAGQVKSLAPSSVRSYLRLNTGTIFEKTGHGRYRLADGQGVATPPGQAAIATLAPVFQHGRCQLFHGDCRTWLAQRAAQSVHAVVTDPPYGLVEYSSKEQAKLRAGKGGVWRIPPSFDGHQRAPLPRFTVLDEAALTQVREFFLNWARALLPVLVPGAHVIVASNPLLSYRVSWALAEAGLERRGEIVRLVMTMRGGDRPKNAHKEFAGVSVMARSMWEPWLVFRKPLEGRVQDNLRRWGTGGLRRPSAQRPFGDVIKSHPTGKRERALAAHPSLKPQAFLRQIVRAALPLGQGVVLDPFAGSGSTLAAAEAVGYPSVGIEADARYAEMAHKAIPRLAALRMGEDTPSLFEVS
ncbi:MAG: DNA methyltransferase [Phycisphaeraceae bacterium]